MNASLDRLADAAWSFAVAVAILAVLAALLLQACWDLGLRRHCQRAWFLQWWRSRYPTNIGDTLDYVFDPIERWINLWPKWANNTLFIIAIPFAFVTTILVAVWYVASLAFLPYSALLLLNLPSWRIVRSAERNLSVLAGTRIHSYYGLPVDRFCAQIAGLVQAALQARVAGGSGGRRVTPGGGPDPADVVHTFTGYDPAFDEARDPRPPSAETGDVPEPVRTAAFRAERAVDDLQAYLDRRARIGSILFCQGICLLLVSGLVESLSDAGPESVRMFFAVGVAAGLLAPVVRKWLEEKVIG